MTDSNHDLELKGASWIPEPHMGKIIIWCNPSMDQSFHCGYRASGALSSRLGVLGLHELDEVNDTGAVAILVIVPSDELDEGR